MNNPSNPYRVEQILWTDSVLMNYMRNPKRFVGSPHQMNFRGIKDFQMRIDIIHYLHTLCWANKDLADPPPRPISGWQRYSNMMNGQREKSWHKKPSMKEWGKLDDTSSTDSSD
eukprot:GEMP01076257.1.p2 GENE.GEMP01076257.1~~GEMP01076257.1.p2  ORF type:complete len:114 (+),score=11.91 GEMP01076257.1:338-679(+)